MSVEDLKQFIPIDSDPFAGAAENSVRFPLTEAQREIWVSSQMGPEASCAYNVCHAFRVRGAFSMDAMKEALQQLVDRHQALRLVCDPDGDTQHELAPAVISVTSVDLSALPAGERERETTHYVGRETDIPFDLENGPLCRAVILREAWQSYLVVFTAHHIVCDGWSSGILIEELRELYEAERAGTPSSLPPAHPFHAYVEARNEPAQQQQAAEAEEYWKAQFATPVPPLELPLDFLRKPVKSYVAVRQRRQIPDALYREVAQLAAQNDCSIYIVLFATMQVLIHRLSAQDDFVLAAVVASQAGEENATTMVGHATNLLPIRTVVDREASFQEHLQNTFEQVLDAFDHQSISLGSLVRSLNLPRDPSRNPLITVSFNFEQVTAPFRFRSMEGELLPSPKRFATFDLEFHFLKSPSGAFVECVHSTALVQPETAVRWLGHFETLLESICIDPARQVAKLPLLTPEQEKELLVRPKARWRIDECVHQRFEAQVERTPHAVAATCESESLTYAGLNRRANAVAKRLVSLGAGPEVLIGLSVERGIGMLVALLAILKTGAAYLPIDLNDPRERVAFTLEDAGAPVLVSQRNLQDSLPKHQAAVLFLDDVTEDGDENIASLAKPENLAYVIYTSGSTGKPKGVEVPHGAVMNMLHSFHELLHFSATDIVVATTTLSFDIAVLELFGSLLAGAKVVIATQAQAQDPLQLSALLHSSGTTIYQATPVRYRALIEAGWRAMPKLQLLCGGEQMTRDLADQLLARCGTLWNVYGPTETTVWSSVAKVEADGRPIAIGRPIANTSLYILDENMRPAPVGVPGELFIGGAGVARGYLHRPQLTAERFPANPFGEGRIYNTGDRARYLADGQVEYLGRIDHQVKIRGFRIELGEIEQALQALPGVLESAAVVHGEGDDKRIIAYLVPVTGVHLTPAELRGSLLQSLPDYMIPAAFVLIEKMPMTGSGKLDRKALPAPDDAMTRLTKDIVPPETETQIRLAALWEDLLKVKNVGIHESFFDLGGHSILAARLMARIRSSFGVQLPLHNIFRFPTVCGLAGLIEAKLWTERQASDATADSTREVEIEI